MVANSGRAAQHEYIEELEELMRNWADATDWESRWILRLLREALAEARAHIPERVARVASDNP